MDKIIYSKITVDTDLWKLFQALVYKQEEIVEWVNKVEDLLPDICGSDCSGFKEMLEKLGKLAKTETLMDKGQNEGA